MSQTNRVFFQTKNLNILRNKHDPCVQKSYYTQLCINTERHTHTQRRSLWSFLSLLWRYFRDIRGYVIQFRRTLGVYCHLPPPKKVSSIPPFFFSLSFPPTSKWACRRRTFVSPGRSHKHFEKKGIGNTFHLLHPNRGPIVC